MDVLRRSRVLEVIDHAVGQHRLSAVSTGECVAVILAGVFVGAHSLWRIRERLAPYDMATVMQDPGFDLDGFPEERLAKALDDVFRFGLDKLMTSLALAAVCQHGLDLADSVEAAEFFGRVRELVSDPREVCLVADSKGWCASTLAVVEGAGMRLLSRLPRTGAMHRELMATPWAPTEVIERPGKSAKAPAERYELMGFDRTRTITVTVTLPEGTMRSDERDIPVRAVRIYSTALLATKLARVRTREARRAQEQIRDWQIMAYACAEDAQRLHDQASFILIRTRNVGWDFTDAEMIDHYRQQYHCEHGFAWLTSGADKIGRAHV